MSHTKRAKAVLSLAIYKAIRGHRMSAGSLIRERVDSCLSTALAMCREDRQEMYKLIDDARDHDE